MIIEIIFILLFPLVSISSQLFFPFSLNRTEKHYSFPLQWKMTKETSSQRAWRIRQGQRVSPFSGKSEGRVIVRPPDWFHRINLPRGLWRSAGLARWIQFHSFYLPYVWIPGCLIPVFGSHFIADANLQIENDRAKRGLPRVVLLSSLPCKRRKRERSDGQKNSTTKFSRSVAFIFFFFFSFGSKQSFARRSVTVDFACNRAEALDLLETHVWSILFHGKYRAPHTCVMEITRLRAAEESSSNYRVGEMLLSASCTHAAPVEFYAGHELIDGQTIRRTVIFCLVLREHSCRTFHLVRLCCLTIREKLYPRAQKLDAQQLFTNFREFSDSYLSPVV